MIYSNIIPMEQNQSHTFRLGTINVRTCKCESTLADYVAHCETLAHDKSPTCFKDDILRGGHLVYNGMKVAQAGVAVAKGPHVVRTYY